MDSEILWLVVIVGILAGVGLVLNPVESTIPPTPAISMINTTSGNVTSLVYNGFVEFIEGSGITITPNYTNNEIIFAATGGGGINNTISSIGLGESIVSGQVLIDHQLKGLSVSGDLVIGSNDTDVIISYIDGLSTGEANTMSSPTHANSLVLAKNLVDLPIKGIACGGSIICSSNTTDVTLTYTATGGGNATNLDDLGDTKLTASAIWHILQSDGVRYVNKLFKIDSVTANGGDTFVTAVNNQTGDITTKQFSVNLITCSGTDKVNSINNATGQVTCSTDQTGSGGAPRGGYLMATWSQSMTKTNIGTAFTNVYTQTNSNGKAILIDTDAFTTARLYVQWNKVGSGTQSCQIINGATVLVSTDVVSGANDSGFNAIPAGLLNAENSFGIQCKSTTAADDPIFEGATIWLK